MENIIERLLKCKSRCEACREFGFCENAVGLKKLQNLADSVGFDIRLFNERFVYSLNIKKCKCCGKELDFLKRALSYCSSSCSAKITNIGKIKTQETKDKIAEKNRVHLKKDIAKIRKERRSKDYIPKISLLRGSANKCNIYIKNCEICNELFTVKSKFKNKKTCSSNCKTVLGFKNRTYQNGSRSTIYFENKNQGTIVLESSWELKLAKYLDSKNIDWIRPGYLRWIDNKGVKRIYYPDFYIDKYDLYVDPKNPYCMEKDKDKMNYFKDKINIIYGNIDDIILYFENVV